jgi:hypothetical protein
MSGNADAKYPRMWKSAIRIALGPL